ncbi:MULTISPECIES: hypothetical protein [unclassified Brucella]|uniref:hypothetical protein n=1 Tax=unclassified Brucella TaxID=2632610 RepID=UPI0012E9D8C1|nr:MULTISPECIES: hypothetical protein [unclassified Brucella]
MPSFKLIHNDSGQYLKAGDFFVNQLAPLYGSDSASSSTWILNQAFDGTHPDNITTYIEGKYADILIDTSYNNYINGIQYTGVICRERDNNSSPTKFDILSLNGSYYIAAGQNNNLTLVNNGNMWVAYLSANPAAWTIIPV